MTITLAADRPVSEADLTVNEVAKRLRRHPQTVRGYIHTGKLPAYRIGDGEFRVREADLAHLAAPIAAAHSDDPVLATPADLTDPGLDDLAALAARMVASWPSLSPDRKAELGRLLATG